MMRNVRRGYRVSEQTGLIEVSGKIRARTGWKPILRASTRKCDGLSLLEVILSLAILGVACTFMAQAMQLSTSNALAAQRQAQAEMAAESVMSQIVAGLIPLQPSSTWTPVGVSASSSNWSYMITVVNCEVENMVGIQLNLKDMSNQDTTSPPDMSVIRWVIDPALGLDTPPSTEETDATGTSSGTGTGAGQSGTTGGLSGKM